jgi:predicted  nucleic acid-binding Zn-ribbon protein
MRFRVALLFIITLLSACDVHKDERLAEQRRLETETANLERLRGRTEDTDRAISKLELEVKEAREDLKTNDAEYEKNKLELAKYSMDHKLAAAAAAAGAAGVAALFSDLDQEQKSAVAVPTALAVGYCLFNGDECTEVSTRIAFFGAQIAVFKGKVSEAQKRESAARNSIAVAESNRQTLKSQAADLGAKITSLRERIQSLQCRFPVCL